MLGHVEGTAHLPASLFDSRYVAFCRERLGPAEKRMLGEDARVLALVAADHSTLARIQLLAWLFDSDERGASSAPTELDALRDEDVDRPELLSALRREREAVEILRCAVELERPVHARLPQPTFDADELAEELAKVTVAAPRLASAELRLVRSLRLRGRVFDDEIWVGVPDPVLGPSARHVTWQAAHEATVAEVSSRAQLPERVVEHAAVVLLGERARRHALTREHAGWLSHFGNNAPSTDPATLPIPAQKLVDELLGDEGSSERHG